MIELLCILPVINTHTYAAERFSKYCDEHWGGDVLFGPDSDKLIFKHHCTKEFYETGNTKKHNWAIYEISKNQIRDFSALNNATPYEVKDGPAFSRDGKMITFTSGEKDHRNIYIINADGSNVRQLTHDYNENHQIFNKDAIVMKINKMPSFSPDGKRIIYAKSAVKLLPHTHPTRFHEITGWDIFEVNIESGKERRLTNYAFYDIRLAGFLSDGGKYIFETDVWNSKDVPNTVITDNVRDEYYEKYNDNFIFIMDDKNIALKPAFINGSNSSEPKIAWDDTILFKSNINEMDGLPSRGPDWYYDLFIYKNGKSKRIFNNQLRLCTDSHDISPEGKLILLKHTRPAIYNLDGRKLMEIEYPWRQLDNLLSDKK